MIKIATCFHDASCTEFPWNRYSLHKIEFDFCDTHESLYLCEHGIFQSEGCLFCTLKPDFLDIDAEADYIQILSFTPGWR